MPDDNSGDPRHAQSVTQRRDGESSQPATVPNDPYPPAAQGISRQEIQSQVHGIEDRVKRAERWMIYLTGAIAFFGLCSVIVGILQWRSMNGQLGEMHEGGIDTLALADAASDQADAAQQFSDTAEDINDRMSDAVDQLSASAESAKSSIQATQAAMRLDQRAWIVFKGVAGVPTLNQPWSLQVYFLNTGKTPAKQVMLSCSVSPVASESEIDFNKGATPDRPTIIAPNDGGTFCMLNPMKIPTVTQDVLDIFLSKRQTLAVYGLATYDDIFKKKHWLTFCRIMLPDGKNWDSCATYNDTGDGEPPKLKKQNKAN
jgi:hypothetical protein